MFHHIIIVIKLNCFPHSTSTFKPAFIVENEQELLKYVSNSVKPIVLLSKVFEHIEPNKAIVLVDKIKSHIDFGKIIITTHDVGFNKHYSPDYDETGEINFRHADHKYEYMQKEFTNIVNKLFNDNQYQKKYYNVGDMIGENSITQSYIISSNI